MKKLSAKTQFKNVKRWLNNLQHTKRLKGTGQLMINKTEEEQLTHKKDKHEYCCLGVGCKLFKIDPKNLFGDGWNAGSNLEFEDMVGIKDNQPIFNINDGDFDKDKDFKRVRKALIKQADSIFNPKVASKIKKYFKVK